jgi:hypothetical protein
MIPLKEVQILNQTNVLDFPATSEITELGFRRGGLHLRHSKEDVWPPVGFETTTQQATLWILANINNAWVGAGMERIRPGQKDKPEGDNPTDFIANWVEGRPFGPFNNHVFKPGESIGVMVVAGNSRLAGEFSVRERTKVVEVQVPPATGQDWPPFLWVEGQVAPAPPPTPQPKPDVDTNVPIAKPDVDTTASAPRGDINAARDEILARISQLETDLQSTKGEILARIDTLEANVKEGLRQFGPVFERLSGFLR